MYKKLIKLVSQNKVDVLIYKVETEKLQQVSLDPYTVVEKRKDWRRFNYKVFDGKEMVHTSTVFSFSLTLRYLKLKGQLIGDCYTNPNYRGLSIYPRMLQYIALRQSILKEESNLFVFVHPENAASISGLEKAGFKKQYYLKAKKMFCFFYEPEIIKFS
jgi:hypothetical protein